VKGEDAPDEIELLRRSDPDAYRALLARLPDVRDGLSRQQRLLLVRMQQLGATHDRPRQGSGRIVLNTPAAETAPPAGKTAERLKVAFPPAPDDEPPEAWTPDLFDGLR